jgi:xylulokinase
MAVVSVDAGTTMIKAVGYDRDGTEATVVRQQTSLSRREPGWVEQDMHEVWRAVLHGVRGVVEELDEPVDYLALTAQGDGCWLVDDTGRPTGPAIVWNDGRAARIIARWHADGLLDKAFKTNGTMGFAGLSHAIMNWLHQHDPDRLARSATALTCGGWLFAQLTGRIGVDTSDGSSPFMDLATGDYSEALLHAYDMAWVRRLLPELLDGQRRIGELTPTAAAALGLPAGLPVVLASFDIAATAIGAGAVTPGQACGILGTTLCTEVVTAAPELDRPPCGMTVHLGVPGLLLRALPAMAGGEVIQWACRMLGLDEPSELGELAAKVAPGAGGLSFHPYLSPAGERAPFLDERARGSLMGLSFEHTRAHVARAVLEGLTMVIADCLRVAGVAPTELRVCGGGAANALWCQLIADLTGVPTSRTKDREVGARGAMVLGAALTGAAPDIPSAAAAHIGVRDTFRADPRRHTVYQELYQDFRALRDIAGTGWPRLARMRERDPDISSTGPLPAVRPESLAHEEQEGYSSRSSQQTVSRPRRTS